MSNKRVVKKVQNKAMVPMVHDIRNKVEYQGELLDDIKGLTVKHDEILKLYYKEYLEMKKQNEKKHLMSYIRMREDLMKDLERLQQKLTTRKEELAQFDSQMSKCIHALRVRGMENIAQIILEETRALRKIIEADNEQVKLLEMYIDQYTTILEDNGIEIISCNVKDEFQPEIARPVSKVDVKYPEMHNKIFRVYGDAYKWNDIVIKKVDVIVCIYRN